MSQYEDNPHPIIIFISVPMIFFGIWIFLASFAFVIIDGSVSSLPVQLSGFLILSGVLLLKIRGKFQLIWLGSIIVLIFGGLIFMLVFFESNRILAFLGMVSCFIGAALGRILVFKKMVD